METQPRKNVFDILIDIERKNQEKKQARHIKQLTGNTEPFELDLTKPIMNYPQSDNCNSVKPKPEAKPVEKQRQPTLKKQYGTKPDSRYACYDPTNANYIPNEGLKIGVDNAGNPIYW